MYAHSVEKQPEDTWQRLPDHLHGVSRLAAAFARAFGCEELAAAAGLLHDLGKYTLEFQQRLRGGAAVDHATWGARIAIECYPGLAGYLVAYGIAGHHAGLANGEGEGRRTSLGNRLKSELPELLAEWTQDLQLPPKLAPPLEFFKGDRGRAQFRMAFLVRMLFSCLVDADFLDTETFYARVEKSIGLRRQEGELPSLETLRAALDEHLSAKRSDAGLGPLRRRILHHVREQSACAPGLFSLTVPTGGGKTLTSLAFALDHAIRHGQQRVIFVIPYTSIVEQNAAVFKEAFGPWGEAAVLEHHSAFADDPGKSREAREKVRLAMENWDSPVVVTTAVQFFESLFADRPSRCRKLHNIANSVVVVDEAQTIPLPVLKPCVAALDELARNYRSSVVLCTATQPALLAPEFDGGFERERVRELAPDPGELSRLLKRVRVRHLGALTDQELVTHLRQREQVLCIVNNRKHARALYESLADLPGACHLSTLMCARHRSQVLARIREDLLAGRPCRLVSTSLIEAGVDISFPTVMREETGLDSIAQAAGRCNREGRWAADDSEVLIFTNSTDEWAPPGELVALAAAAREVLRGLGPDDDPLHPSAIRTYFEKLYWQKGTESLDKEDLLGLLRRSQWTTLPMDTLSEKFRMIDSVQFPVIVPWSGDVEASTALRELEYAEGTIGIARRLQSFVVQVPKQAYDALFRAGAIRPVRPDKWGDQFMELVNPELYNENYGLSWDDPTLIGVQSLAW